MLASGKIKNSVIKILSDCGIVAPPVDLRIVTEHFGLCYVEVSSLPDDIEAFILPNGSRVDAVINKDQPKTLCRFSLAHQLYHFQFEGHPFVTEGRIRPPALQDVTTISSKRKRSEVLADMFAAELLLPISFLQKHYRVGLSGADIASVFQVSRALATWAISSQYNLF